MAEIDRKPLESMECKLCNRREAVVMTSKTMPQFDTATYRGQVTWFVIVFSVFYLVMRTDVLPRLNRAVKVRAKKVERTRNDARQFDGVRASSEEGVDRQGVRGSMGARTRISRVQSNASASARQMSRKLLMS